MRAAGEFRGLILVAHKLTPGCTGFLVYRLSRFGYQLQKQPLLIQWNLGLTKCKGTGKTLHYYWAEKYCSLYRGLHYIEPIRSS